MISIRMQRGGRVHRPIYTIVATDSRNARNGSFLEKLGQYDPLADVVLKDVKTDGLKKWLERGAQLSPTVRSLLKKQKISLQ